MLKYYNGTAWKLALIHVKLAFHCYTMLKYFFPLTDTHIEDAELILSKMVTDTYEEKITFDSSEFLFFYWQQVSMLFLYRFCSNERDEYYCRLSILYFHCVFFWILYSPGVLRGHYISWQTEGLLSLPFPLIL